MIYIPANDNLCMEITARPVEYSPGRPFMGTTMALSIAPGADHIGEVQAWNVDTGKRVWTHNYMKSPNWGPMLTTGGGLVFTGGTADRKNTLEQVLLSAPAAGVPRVSTYAPTVCDPCSTRSTEIWPAKGTSGARPHISTCK